MFVYEVMMTMDVISSNIDTVYDNRSYFKILRRVFFKFALFKIVQI